MHNWQRTDADLRVAAVIRALEADLGRPWTVSQMAALAGVSDAQLRRLFARAMNASPLQVLCNLRLQAAARLLEDPSIRVKEIQARVGFADASHFSRDFRCRFGVSPIEYRMQRAGSTDS